MSEGKGDKKPNLAGWAAVITAFATLVTAAGFPDFFPDLVKRFFPESSSESTSSPSPQITPSIEESSPVVIPTPSPSDSSVSPIPSPTTLTPVAPEPTPLQWTDTALSLNLNGRLDQDFTYNCPSGGRVGSLWGTDIYTTDSSICTAAVHAGRINARKGGKITIRIDPGQDAYNGSTRNGVKSIAFGNYKGSFSFLK